MREILFRGKRTDIDAWAYGYLNKHPSAIQVGKGSPYYIEIPPRDPDDDGGRYNVHRETVGQYTGLTDKNGKKIFEGDICKFNEPFGRSGMTLFVVEWDNVNARVLGFTIGGIGRYMVYVGREPKCEVIGNIHDNPELLKGGEGK